MLCLSRHAEEAIMIGDDLLVRVEEVEPKRARVSITRVTTLDPPRELWMARDEEVEVGQDVTVSIVDIRDGKVRLGMVTPKEVSVNRKEVYDVIRRERDRGDDGMQGSPVPR